MDNTKQSHTKSIQNNLHSVHSRPCIIHIRVIWTSNTALHMATHPKVQSLTLDPKLTYSTHIHNISVRAHNPLQMLKALTTAGWGKQKEQLMVTYKAVVRPALEYASYILSLIAYSTSINKLQVMQNVALRPATGCTQDTIIQRLHDETLTFLIHEHLQINASQYKQKTQHPSHPLHKHTTYLNTPRLKTHYLPQRPLYNIRFHSPPHSHYNKRHMHIFIVSSYLATRGNNNLLHTSPPHISGWMCLKRQIYILMERGKGKKLFKSSTG